jgi:hypothetical protein
MPDIARISDCLDGLAGIEGLREHIESTIRDQLNELLIDPLKALVKEQGEEAGCPRGDGESIYI